MIKEVRRFSSVEELLNAKNELGSQAVFLSGGTEVNRKAQAALSEKGLSLLSLQGLDLEGITSTEEGVAIGSATTFSAILASDEVPEYMKEACAFCASPVLRNMATIGGNIAAFRPDSYLLGTLIAAKVRIITLDIDNEGNLYEEDVPVREFAEHFTEFSGSLITKVLFNKSSRCVRTRRFARTASRIPDLSLSIGATCQEKTMSELRIVASADRKGYTRLIPVEEGIENHSLITESEILAAVKRCFTPESDLTGSTEYKQYLAATTIESLLSECRQKSAEGDCSW